VKKNLIILLIATAVIVIAVHVGIRVFSVAMVEPGLSEETLAELQEWYYHNEHVFYAEMPVLGGTGRDRIVCMETSRRYDVILHRYELGRYSFEQKVNYLLTQVFPYSIHMIANRGLMRANLAFNSTYDILVVPSDYTSIVFIARAEEESYSVFPVRAFNTRIVDMRANEEEKVYFFLSSHTEMDTWADLKERMGQE